ncbi:hypothetical protein MLD38_032547 [Melastoma candidum]|uniref:Uncharacterized protein n=1 Tax=Melastoma candidum TaxID=119954 RepID=A0ACB9M884_9MYRT|nr:hypothetical protein MLD38_032547 [Melastoma candidum]
MQSAKSSTNSPGNAARKPKGKALRPIDHRSPRGISSPEIIRLQEELRNVKSELICSESEKTRAQMEAAEARRQLAAVLNQLNETRSRLSDLSDSEDARVQELRKISLERDKAWQSELEAVQKQKSLDSAALVSARNEIKKLKLQLGRVAESEANQAKHAESAYHELRNIREELSETLVLVENLRNELSESRESEARALEMAGNTQRLLDIANVTAETLHSESMKVKEDLDVMSYELERSKARETELEAIVRHLQEKLNQRQKDGYHDHIFGDSETDQLKFAVETSEIGCDASKHLKSMLPINAANAPIPPTNREEFPAFPKDDSKEVRKLTEENELLKEKLKKQEMEMKVASKDASALLDIARSAKEEALTKLGHTTEEANRNRERAALVTELLEAARAENTEMMEELRRLKVQLDQWRKAAELAAAMVSGTNDGKATEIRGSAAYVRFSPDDNEDDNKDSDGSPKRSNGNVLKKIGVMWKKGTQVK